MSEPLRDVIRKNEGILHAPFLGIISTEADRQIRSLLSRNLGISWNGHELDFPEGSSRTRVAKSALKQISDQMAVEMLPLFMGPVEQGERTRHGYLLERATDLGEQLSDEDQLGTQRMARRILRSAKRVVAERGWGVPDDLDMFERNVKSFRVMEDDFHSQRPYLRLFNYERLLSDKPEGSRDHPPVNFAARFKGSVFESVRLLQFASRTGLMLGYHKGDLYPQRAKFDINLSALPELTKGLNINAYDWQLDPQRLQEYHEATDGLTNDLLNKMGFLRSGQRLDPGANVNFEGSGCYLKHPREPKLYARAKRNWATRLGDDRYYDAVTVFYAYDRPSDEYLKEKYPSRYPTF